MVLSAVLFRYVESILTDSHWTDFVNNANSWHTVSWFYFRSFVYLLINSFSLCYCSAVKACALQTGSGPIFFGLFLLTLHDFNPSRLRDNRQRSWPLSGRWLTNRPQVTLYFFRQITISTERRRVGAGNDQLVKKSTRPICEKFKSRQFSSRVGGQCFVVMNPHRLSLPNFRDLSVTSWPCDELTVFRWRWAAIVLVAVRALAPSQHGRIQGEGGDRGN